MVKFFKLVQNEYIKILHRISTWIMLGLVILTALGLNLISLVVQNNNYSNTQRTLTSSYSENMYDSEISYQKESKPDGYEQNIERLEFLRDNKIGRNDWRSTAATDMTKIKKQLTAAEESKLDAKTTAQLTKLAQDFKDAILANNWETYYKLKIDQFNTDTSLSQEKKDIQKWQYQYCLDNNITPDIFDWKSNLITSIGAEKSSVFSMQEQQTSGEAVDVGKMEDIKKDLLINQYRLDHDVRIDISSASMINGTAINFWSVFSTSAKIISIISLLIIVVAGSCVANEFSSGTIKFLLINPVKRGKILASKYMMVISLSYVMLLLFFVMNVIFTTLFYGTGDIGIPYLSVSNGTVKSIPGLAYIAWLYLLASADTVVMATLAFAISSVIRSSALAIGIGVFAMLGGKTLIYFLKDLLKMDWARYFIFANTDLASIVKGGTSFQHLTVSFALIVITIHMVVFLLTAWDGFVRREV